MRLSVCISPKLRQVCVRHPCYEQQTGHVHWTYLQTGQVLVGHPYHEQQRQVFAEHPYYEQQTRQVFF